MRSGAARAGRTGAFRITATPPWAETVLARAATHLRKTFPAIEFHIESATRGEGLCRLADGHCDLHCGGVDSDLSLPAFLRRESFLDMTAGIVAWHDHPLFAGTVAPENLARYPRIDFDYTPSIPIDDTPPVSRRNPGPVRRYGVARDHRAAPRCGRSVYSRRRPWLAWLPLGLLERLPDGPVRPLPVDIGRFRYRSGFIARRSTEDLPPFRTLEQAVRDIALGRQK